MVGKQNRRLAALVTGALVTPKGPKTMLPHQPRHSVLAATLSKLSQIMIDAGTAINTTAGKI